MSQFTYPSFLVQSVKLDDGSCPNPTYRVFGNEGQTESGSNLINF